MTASAGGEEEVREFVLPDLGEGLTEAEIVRWLVKVGDLVSVDQPVVEVETAKAVVEVPCPYAGVVTSLWGEQGESRAVGQPLIAVAERRPERAGGSAPDSGGTAVAAGEESGNVLVGYGTSSRAGRRRRTLPTAAQAPVATGRPDADLGPVRVISPLVRRLAKEQGVDLRQLRGSGPDGLILRADVERVNGERGNGGHANGGERAPVTAPPASPGAAEVVRTPLRGLRRTVAEKLVRSRGEIPDATTWVDVDATRLMEARKLLNSRGEDQIPLLALLARVCVAGLLEFPELNSSVDTARQEVVRYSAVHLGFAAQTERGLVVPVVKDAHRKTLPELAAEVKRLTAEARNGTLSPAELSGGTFTLNNYGVFGVDGSTPIINHPEAAMLGVGRILPRCWVVDGRPEVRRICQLSFTFDHRVCDGATAGGFLRRVADLVEEPLSMLRLL